MMEITIPVGLVEQHLTLHTNEIDLANKRIAAP